MKNDNGQIINTIEWCGDHIKIIDQTYLPDREVHLALYSIGQVWEAIRELRVRGAPAIGIAGVYGLFLGAKELPESGFESLAVELERLSEYLLTSRPTAVNLEWGLQRIRNTVHAGRDESMERLKEVILETAIMIHDEDCRLCKSIGENGAGLVPEKGRVLTYCNTGSLATGRYGTAYSVIWHARQQKRLDHVWVCETRPLLQGSRLTAWELQKDEIPFKVITDNTAGYLMQLGEVDMVVVGADRIAANGDTVNKIGTYSLAVLAKENGIPFYVAAPYSTIDMNIAEGKDIPIEERRNEEVTHFMTTMVTPKKTGAYNPAFDVTPQQYITGIITDKGVITTDFQKNLKAHLASD